MYQTTQNKTHFLLLLAYILYPLVTFTQSYHFHQYTIQDGLPTNSIYGTIQDREGYLWVFTEKGVSKFDGYEFKTFTMEDGLPSNDVWDLTQDSKGRIWVHTTSSQLVYIYEDSVYAIKTSGDITLKIPTIYETGDKIWFKNGNGEIYQIIGDTLEKVDYTGFRKAVGFTRRPFYYQEDLVPITAFLSPKKIILLGKKHTYYLDNEGILLRPKGYNTTKENTALFNILNPTTKEHFNRVEYEYIENRYLFFFTEYGIGRWSHTAYEEKGLSFSDVFEQPQAIFSIAVPEKNGYQCTLYPSPNFLTIDYDLNIKDQFTLTDFPFRRIFKDNENNLWVATETDGLFLLTANARNARTFVPNNDKRVLSVTGDLDGHIFWSTAAGNVYQLAGNASKPLLKSGGINKNAKSLLLDDLGHLYVGLDNNALQINIGNAAKTPIIKSIQFDLGLQLSTALKRVQSYNTFPLIRNVKDYAWDEQQKILWASTGMEFFKIDFSIPLGKIKKIANLRRINAVAIEKNGKTWLGSAKGLLQLNQQAQITKEYEKQPLLKQKIIDLTIDTNNILWIGTEGLGAYGYDGEHIIPIPDTKGDIVSSLFLDDNQFLWVTSNKGVKQIYINPKEPTENYLVRHYTTNDGLASNETNAIFVDSNYIYVGTNQGLTRINKQEEYRDTSKPNLKIEKIGINDIEQPIKLEYHLNYSENTLTIAFVALSYKSFKNIEYQYLLINADKDFQQTTNRTIRYTNLPSGRYTFILKATDITGREQALSEPIVFIIQPPFWQTNWFRFLVFLIFFGLLYSIYHRRVKRIRQKAALKAANDQKFAELELQALRSQMNPHFVFNALTAIQYFINEKNVKEADNYLAKFGKLMRLFLESTKTKFISLDQELILLRLYIDLEQVRFEDKFDTLIKIDEQLDLTDLRIPTLLVQPFVENAINHGLFHKEGKGHLEIHFRQPNENVLLIKIKDDGIGRKAARKIRQHSIKGYQSRGLQIVAERIKVLQNNSNLNIEVKTIDLEDSRGNGIGTEVFIQMLIH